MNTLDLSFISRFRSSFMGFAIFWIFFYHTGVDIPVLKHFFALGWLGVDIFFLLIRIRSVCFTCKGLFIQALFSQKVCKDNTMLVDCACRHGFLWLSCLS